MPRVPEDTSRYELIPGETPEVKRVREALTSRVPHDRDHFIAMLYISIYSLLTSGGDPDGIIEVVSGFIVDFLQRGTVNSDRPA